MMKIKNIIVIVVIISFTITGITYFSTIPNNVKNDEVEFSGYSPLFRHFAYEKDFRIIKGEHVPLESYFELKPELNNTYAEIGLFNKSQNAIVIVPIFTSSAYWEPGFYTYYRGECDFRCLTTTIKTDYPLGYSGSANAVKILKLLGYEMMTDLEVDKNPDILESYDKVIILHNEYVTQNEFDAITRHPKVIYLYPNALYAKIIADHDRGIITLIRGHNYPEPEVMNGFDWKFDNTNPYEFDNECKEWEFYEVDNGIMLNCYPENIIYTDKSLLKIIKDY